MEYVNVIKLTARLGPKRSGDPIYPRLITADAIKQNPPTARVNFIVFLITEDNFTNSVFV